MTDAEREVIDKARQWNKCESSDNAKHLRHAVQDLNRARAKTQRILANDRERVIAE